MSGVELPKPLIDELVAVRRHLHAHPELGFDCDRTASLVAQKLRDYGVDEVHTGIARTGVVGVIRGRRRGGSMGLRADMDALPIAEQNRFFYASRRKGVMHACGHDGHTAMLLGAARYLAETRRFAGTVHLIFQPAEEGGGGGRVMCEEGLFRRFDCERIFAVHNRPELEIGKWGSRVGPFMAAADSFEIEVTGRGGHAARPHLLCDPMVVAAQLVLAIQTVVSRSVNPLEPAVVGVSAIEGGDLPASNVVPDRVVMTGTVRSYDEATRDLIEARLSELVAGVCAAYRAQGRLTYRRGYPPVVNTPAETEFAHAVASEVWGPDNADMNYVPSMGGEDFSFMLRERPGCYAVIGQAIPGQPLVPLHSTRYDFCDAIIPQGVRYFVRLVERGLPL
ncbi:MAG: M20 family metallopeptidase [Casimicrobiaceae bacterium]|nr:M20 family metallopeptidase [Casimicrobiaceae bacterium]MDW8311372.1 M20 aminoacylase family protein [Burkholderiales bacterium]